MFARKLPQMRSQSRGFLLAVGRRVRPGVYMVRLALDGSVQSSRVVVVR